MPVSTTLHKMKNATEAQIGIGTLIIFIAMVLVAAVAAAVLIQTSGVLQQNAMSTGKEASKEVSSNLQIQQIEGFRSKNTDTDMSATIDTLKLTVGLNAASEPVDLNQVIVTITDGYTTNDLVYAGNYNTIGRMENFSDSNTSGNFWYLVGATTGGINNTEIYFAADKIRDDDGSFSQGNPVITTGDVILLYVPTVAAESYTKDYAYLLGHYMIVNYPVYIRLRGSGLELLPRTTVTLILTPEAGASATADFTLPTTFGENERVALYP